jgi:hypothetical protein
LNAGESFVTNEGDDSVRTCQCFDVGNQFACLSEVTAWRIHSDDCLPVLQHRHCHMHDAHALCLAQYLIYM